MPQVRLIQEAAVMLPLDEVITGLERHEALPTNSPERVDDTPEDPWDHPIPAILLS